MRRIDRPEIVSGKLFLVHARVGASDARGDLTDVGEVPLDGEDGDVGEVPLDGEDGEDGEDSVDGVDGAKSPVPS